MMVMVVTVAGRGAIRNIGNGGHDGGELSVKSSSWFWNSGSKLNLSVLSIHEFMISLASLHWKTCKTL